MKLLFHEDSWQQYLYWQENDRKVLQRINTLIKECMRDPTTGIGKPEPLRHQLAGWWSCRITDEHRLVYRLTGETLLIAQCRYHY